MMCSPGSQERAQLHAKRKASGAEAQGASAKRGGEQRKFGVRHSCLGCSYEKYDSRERDFLNQGRCFFKLIIDRCTRCPVPQCWKGYRSCLGRAYHLVCDLGCHAAHHAQVGWHGGNLPCCRVPAHSRWLGWSVG